MRFPYVRDVKRHTHEKQRCRKATLHNVIQPFVPARLGNLNMEACVAFGQTTEILSLRIKVVKAMVSPCAEVVLVRPIDAQGNGQRMKIIQDHTDVGKILRCERDYLRLSSVADIQQPVCGKAAASPLGSASD